MQELGMLPLINGDATRVIHSALPDSPIVPERPPGRLRLRAAAALHGLAARLDGQGPSGNVARAAGHEYRPATGS
jgi:hypothetical protein